MEAIELSVETRSQTGSGAAGRIRQSGGIPAVVYGDGAAAVPVTVSEAAIQKLLRVAGKRLSLVSISIKDAGGEKKETAIIKAVQRHPVNEQIIHIDFLRIAMDKPLSLEVPVAIEGTAPGIKLGGILQQMLRQVRIRCLPDRIPQAAVADVSGLAIGGVLTARDLKLPEGVNLVTRPDQAILSITVTRYEEEEKAPATPEAEAAAAAAEAPAQPEVIGEKERDERRTKKDEEKGVRVKEKQELKETKAKEEKGKKK